MAYDPTKVAPPPMPPMGQNPFASYGLDQGSAQTQQPSGQASSDPFTLAIIALRKRLKDSQQQGAAPSATGY